jgi:hypothetical protein
MEQLRSFIEKFPMHICLLSFHHAARSMIEIAIENGILPNVVQQIMTILNLIIKLIFSQITSLVLFIAQQFITESVHHRNIV